MVSFLLSLGYLVTSTFLIHSRCSEKQPGDKWCRFITGQMPFLSPKQQHQGNGMLKALTASNEKSPTGFILS